MKQILIYKSRNENEMTQFCIVHNVINLIFGLCRFIHEHERTQLDIDEEMIRSFDKLYPHNFRLLVNPILLEGIVKKMDCTEENGMNSKNIILY